MQTSDYIATFAGMIALASFVVTVGLAWITRRHNRLSVRPLLSIYRREFNDQPIEYILVNRGLGPAIVKELTIWVDDKKVDASDGNFTFAAIDLLRIDRNVVNGHQLSVGEAISPNQEIILLTIGHNEDDAAEFEVLIGKLPRLKFKVNYSSIYEESNECYSNG